MASTKPASFSLKPVVEDDIPALAEMSGLAFKTDRHTMLKAAHPINPYDHAAGMPGAFKYWLSLPPGKIEITKAVDDESDEILGFVAWGVSRLQKSEPEPEVGEQSHRDANESSAEDIAPAPEQVTTAGEAIKDAKDKGEGVKREDLAKNESADLDAIEQLEQVTSAHLAEFQERTMPPGVRCMYVVSITVHPNHQGRGVGPALIQRGTDRADAERVFCWVHSSEAGVAMFHKCGFEEVDTLEIDLDEWAGKMDIKPPVGNERWGKYTFRYCVRQPRII